LNELRRLLLFAGALLFMGSTFLPEDDRHADSLTLIGRASQLEELRKEGSAPFVMQGHIEAAIGKKRALGQYSLLWQARDHWREELVLGEFRRIRVSAEGGYRQIRSWDYQPMMAFELDRVLNVPRVLLVTAKERIEKARTRKLQGVALSCVEIRNKNGTPRQVCFDRATELLAHAELNAGLMSDSSGSSDLLKVDYSGAMPLGEKTFPAKLRVQKGGEFSMEMVIDRLELATAKDAIVPLGPDHSEFWETCQDEIPTEPELMEKQAPNYPSAARAALEAGIVSLYLRIEPDGTVSHLKTLQAPSPSLEGAARQAVEHWKYRPPSCREIPIKTETAVDITFSLVR
jgi:TonB family protein